MALTSSRSLCTRSALLIGLSLLLGSCQVLSRPPAPPAPEPHRAAEGLTVAAWAEPSRLPPGGGQAQILVRVRKRSGRPYPGVEVSIRVTEGRLYSEGRLLVTEANGMTRDRLTARRSSQITVNAGGTRYSFVVPVLPRSAAPDGSSGPPVR